MQNGLEDHIERYKSDYASVGFLNMVGDQFELNRDACFIRRKTMSAKDQAAIQHREQLKQTKVIRDVRSEPGLPLPLSDAEVINRIRNGKTRRLFITGEGGMGKTEYTRLIAYELAKHFDADTQDALPYRFELKCVKESYPSGRRFFEEKLAPDDHEWLVPLAERGKVVFIFDGLDEVGIDAEIFTAILRNLLHRFKGSTFILAGRPGSLGKLEGFGDAARHILQPLTFPDIRRYVMGVFKLRPGARALGPRLVAEIQAKQSSLFPIIQQPFMLAMACQVFATPDPGTEGHALPANPAQLVEKALKEIFDRRTIGGKDHDLWLGALSTLAAFTLTQSRKVVRLSLPREHAKRLLRQHPPIQLATDRDAQVLLEQLAPACGVLNYENGLYTFANRVIAEFLAAKWIVRYGYPDWPYRPAPGDQENEIGLYTRLADPLERQIIDFLGDHVWTIERRDLAQAVRFELSRTQRGSTLVIHFARWIQRQIEPYYTGVQEDLDIRSTLAFRVFRCLQTCQALSTQDERQAKSILSKLVSSAECWHESEFWTSAIGLIPWPLSEPYLESFESYLKTILDKPELNETAIRHLPHAISKGWPRDERVFETLKVALTNAKNNEIVISGVAGAIAVGWPGDERAFVVLEATLRSVRDNPRENIDSISSLGHAIAYVCPGEEKALAALDEVLQIARTDPMEHWALITNLAEAMAEGWPGERRTNAASRVAFAVLDATLEIAVAACVSAEGWPADNRAFRSLQAAYNFIKWRPKNSTSIGNLAPAIAFGWPGDDRAFTALEAALKSVWDKPNENNESIIGLAAAIAFGWPGDDRAFAMLEAALEIARGEPDENSLSIFALAHAIAAGWPGDDRAFVVLEAALRIARDEPSENWHVIHGLADAIASGWPGDERAFEVLGLAFKIARGEPNKNWTAIHILAKAIAAGWPGDERAFEVLDAALKIASDDSKQHSHATSDLAESMAKGWPGHQFAASRIVAVNRADKLDCDEWLPWVTLIGKEAALAKWIGRRGEKWGLEGDPTFSWTPIEKNADDEQLILVIAPREKIRRGLDPSLLPLDKDEPEKLIRQAVRGFVPLANADDNTDSVNAVDITFDVIGGGTHQPGNLSPEVPVAIASSSAWLIGDQIFEAVLDVLKPLTPDVALGKYRAEWDARHKGTCSRKTRRAVERIRQAYPKLIARGFGEYETLEVNPQSLTQCLTSNTLLLEEICRRFLLKRSWLQSKPILAPKDYMCHRCGTLQDLDESGHCPEDCDACRKKIRPQDSEVEFQVSYLKCEKCPTLKFAVADPKNPGISWRDRKNDIRLCPSCGSELSMKRHSR